MLYVATSDGKTLKIDLANEDDLKLWREISSIRKMIRSVSLGIDGSQVDLPLPRRFNEVRYEAELIRNAEGEPVAEQASVICDGALCTLTMYLNGRSGRYKVGLDKRGKRRFRPS